jgi:predicted ATP-dependent endonuclease of OLD family
MDKATRQILFVNTRNAHNKQKQKGYNIITKNDEGLLDNEDKGKTIRYRVSVTTEVSKDCSSFSFSIKQPRPP